MLTSAPAHAGRWFVYYSGGQSQVNGSTPNPYVTGPGGPIATNPPLYTGGNGNSISRTGSTVASASGAITATFVWQPNPGGPPDPPPAEIYIREDCQASWSASDANANATGSCDDGLNGTKTSVTSGKGEVSTGTRYTKKTVSGTTVTVSCSPSANVNSQPTPPLIIRAGCGVTYTARIVPVMLQILGTQPDPSGNPEILIGQCAIGQVLCSDSSIQLRNVVWDAPIYSFKNYNASADRAFLEYLSPADLTQVTADVNYPKWYWYADGNSKVSCTVDLYQNNTKISTLSLSQSVSVVAPEYYLGPERGYTIFKTDPGNKIDRIGVKAGDDFNNKPGMKWYGKIKTPLRFRLAGAGRGTYIQLVNWYYRQFTPFNFVTSTTNGEFWLDSDYPNYGNYVFNADSPTTSDAFGDDSPEVDFLAFSITSIDVNDQFKTYLMYEPPNSGFGTQRVPLNRLDWDWKVDATKSDPYHIDWFFLDTSIDITFNGRCTRHPEWNKLWSNTHVP